MTALFDTAGIPETVWGGTETQAADLLACSDGCGEGPVALTTLEVVLASFLPLGDVSSAVAGCESDAEVLFAWTVMGTWL